MRWRTASNRARAKQKPFRCAITKNVKGGCTAFYTRDAFIFFMFGNKAVRFYDTYGQKLK